MSVPILLILVLTLVLAALLIDWPGLLQRLRKNKAKVKPPKVRTDRSIAAVTPPKGGDDLFSMDLNNLPEDTPPSGLSKEVQDLLAEADIHFRKGEYKAAEKFYLQAAAKDPRCSKAYSRLGVIYLENGEDWEDAEAAFRQALKTDPENGYILNNLGLVLYHQDKY